MKQDIMRLRQSLTTIPIPEVHLRDAGPYVLAVRPRQHHLALTLKNLHLTGLETQALPPHHVDLRPRPDGSGFEAQLHFAHVVMAGTFHLQERERPQNPLDMAAFNLAAQSLASSNPDSDSGTNTESAADGDYLQQGLDQARTYRETLLQKPNGVTLVGKYYDNNPILAAVFDPQTQQGLFQQYQHAWKNFNYFGHNTAYYAQQVQQATSSNGVAQGLKVNQAEGFNMHAFTMKLQLASTLQTLRDQYGQDTSIYKTYNKTINDILDFGNSVASNTQNTQENTVPMTAEEVMAAVSSGTPSFHRGQDVALAEAWDATAPIRAWLESQPANQEPEELASGPCSGLGSLTLTIKGHLTENNKTKLQSIAAHWSGLSLQLGTPSSGDPEAAACAAEKLQQAEFILALLRDRTAEAFQSKQFKQTYAQNLGGTQIVEEIHAVLRHAGARALVRLLHKQQVPEGVFEGQPDGEVTELRLAEGVMRHTNAALVTLRGEGPWTCTFRVELRAEYGHWQEHVSPNPGRLRVKPQPHAFMRRFRAVSVTLKNILFSFRLELNPKDGLWTVTERGRRLAGPTDVQLPKGSHLVYSRPCLEQRLRKEANKMLAGLDLAGALSAALNQS